MTTQQWIVGSELTADLVIVDPTVSRKHCRLSRINHEYFIEDLVSRNGTFVDGQRVVKRTPVTPRSVITLAESVTLPWPDEAVAMRIIRVGRHPENDLVLDHETVSAFHALLIGDPRGQWLVRDLGSANGTSIGTPPQPMKLARVLASDAIHFGRVGGTLAQWIESAGEGPKVATSELANPSPTVRGQVGSGAGSSTSPTASPASSMNADGLNVPMLAKIVASVACVVLLLVGGWRSLVSDASPPAENATPTREPVVGDVIAKDDVQKGSPVAEPPPRPVPSVVAPIKTAALTSGKSLAPTSTSATDASALDESSPAERIERLRDALMLIVLVDRDGQPFRVGSGIAVSPRHVLTCGRAAETRAETLGEEFQAAELLHVASGRSFAIAKQLVSPKWTDAQTSLRESIESLQAIRDRSSSGSPGEVDRREMTKLYQLAKTCQHVARVNDVGLIVAEEDLPGSLESSRQTTRSASPASWMEPADHDLPALATLRLIGPFFDAEAPSLVGQSPPIDEQVVKPLKLLDRVSPTMQRLVLAKMPGGRSLGMNFGGCPVVNAAGRVVGLFAAVPRREDALQDPVLARAVDEEDLLFDLVSTEVMTKFLKLHAR